MAPTYGPKVYHKLGSDELVVASGGQITVESGGTLENSGTMKTDVLAETTSATGVTVDGVILKDTTVDVNGTADAIILDADADTTISAPTDDQLDFEVGAEDIVRMHNPSAGEHPRLDLLNDCRLDTAKSIVLFDDFFNQSVLGTEADGPWILSSGGDAEALDPAINDQIGGVLRTITGDVTAADDSLNHSFIVGKNPWQAANGALTMEVRLDLVSAITGQRVFVGFTSATNETAPSFEITGASDTLVSNAANAVGFLFDQDATTKEWFLCGVDGNSDATGVGASGTAPTADVRQTLRIEIDADGEGAEFFINDVSVGSLTANVVAASTNIFPIVWSSLSSGTTTRNVDIDYIHVSSTR